MAVLNSFQNFSKYNEVSKEQFQRTNLYRFGPFELNEQERVLLCYEREVKITSKEFDVLLVLLRNRSKLVTKRELMDKVWPDSFVSEANLSVHIASLRKALRENSDQSYIQTVTKFGYKFVGDVKVLANDEESPNLYLEQQQQPPARVDHLESIVKKLEGTTSRNEDSADPTVLFAGGLQIETRNTRFGTEIVMTIRESFETNSPQTDQRTLQCDGIAISTVLHKRRRFITVEFPESK